jgi:TRAP-type C4-dicarboxylate transport system permease small subunit
VSVIPAQPSGLRRPAFLDRIITSCDRLDKVLVWACALATIGAGLVLTYSVLVRYFLQISTDWQDEMAVFLLVGATFLSAPYVQAVRGHIAIEAVEEFLPRGVERFRALVSDIVCLAFCAFFDWQCWLLLLEAVEDGRVTDSSWAPPLWIPYSLMTAGMTLLCLRFALQILDGVISRRETPA